MMLTGTPLDLTPFGPLLTLAGVLYWLLALGAAALALWWPRAWWLKLPLTAGVLTVFVYPVIQHVEEMKEQHDDSQTRLKESMAQFAERCKTAGEKIYRTVDDVDGVLLTNVRPKAKIEDRGDRNWPDAALPNEGQGDWYIRSFLFWEHHEDKRSARGYLNEQRSDLRGYRFVDVKDTDGKVHRYRLAEANDGELSRELVSGPSARYVVSFVNMVDPADREKWIAGTKVSITDTATGEVIAEHTWFSIEPGQGSTAGFRSPWGFAATCPALNGWGRSSTRFFVDKVLKPNRGN